MNDGSDREWSIGTAVLVAVLACIYVWGSLAATLLGY